MLNSKAIGDRSVVEVLARLVARSEVVLMPFGDNDRYDLAVERRDGTLVRIQVKTGRLSVDGAVIRFHTCSSYAHRGLGRRDYRGDADLFGVYVPELDAAYLVPVEAVGGRGCHLRLKPARNRQSRGVRWAQDYELLKLPVPRAPNRPRIGRRPERPGELQSPVGELFELRGRDSNPDDTG